MSRRDVFSLENIYELQIQGNWSTKNDVWLASNPYTVPGWEYGYFGGGGFPADSSTIDRIDYSNDTATASVRGPLSESVFGNTACSPVANGL